MRADRSRRLAGPALALAVALTGGLVGCSNDLDDRATTPELEAEVPDIRGPEDHQDPYTGLLDARFVEDLPAYEDLEVTVVASVAEVLSPRIFSITSPDGTEVDPVLVVTTDAAADIEPEAGDHLVVAATPVRGFDAEAVVEELGLDLGAQQLENWEDETYLVATIVETAP